MNTERLAENTERAAELLRAGGIVAVPTETVYGLAVNALDEAAVARLYAVKGRPAVKPLSLMVPGASAIGEYCRDVPAAAKRLAAKFWPGPLTLVFKSRKREASVVRAGGNTVGLRCPDHPLTAALLRRCGVPLAVPSANLSERAPARTAAEVLDVFDGMIDGVLDGGESSLGAASTVFDVSETPYRVLRAGALGEAELFAALRETLTIVGLTGGSGSGKTTALRVLERMGALVIDADAVYHALTVSSAPLRAELTARFGAVYDGDALDRRRLAEIVFSDPAALADLNAITHKYVAAEIDRLLTEHARRGGTLAAIDAIALLESPLAAKCALRVAVTAPREHRLRRLTARDGISQAAAIARIDAQRDDAYFEARCDHVLRNAGAQAEFEQNCNQFFTEVLNHG